MIVGPQECLPHLNFMLSFHHCSFIQVLNIFQFMNVWLGSAVGRCRLLDLLVIYIGKQTHEFGIVSMTVDTVVDMHTEVPEIHVTFWMLCHLMYSGERFLLSVSTQTSLLTLCHNVTTQYRNDSFGYKCEGYLLKNAHTQFSSVSHNAKMYFVSVTSHRVCQVQMAETVSSVKCWPHEPRCAAVITPVTQIWPFKQKQI